MFAPFKSHATAYRNVAVESGVAAGDPHQLVTMLFDGALSAIAEARGALAGQEVAAKGQAITRAVRIVDEGLRAPLDLRAGELAAQLHQLYGYIIQRLTLANLRNDDVALQECARLLSEVRSGWVGMQRQAA